jgi:hypothetical protein
MGQTVLGLGEESKSSATVRSSSLIEHSPRCLFVMFIAFRRFLTMFRLSQLMRDQRSLPVLRFSGKGDNDDIDWNDEQCANETNPQ